MYTNWGGPFVGKLVPMLCVGVALDMGTSPIPCRETYPPVDMMGVVCRVLVGGAVPFVTEIGSRPFKSTTPLVKEVSSCMVVGTINGAVVTGNSTDAVDVALPDKLSCTCSMMASVVSRTLSIVDLTS